MVVECRAIEAAYSYFKNAVTMMRLENAMLAQPLGGFESLETHGSVYVRDILRNR